MNENENKKEREEKKEAGEENYTSDGLYDGISYPLDKLDEDISINLIPKKRQKKKEAEGIPYFLTQRRADKKGKIRMDGKTLIDVGEEVEEKNGAGRTKPGEGKKPPVNPRDETLVLFDTPKQLKEKKQKEDEEKQGKKSRVTPESKKTKRWRKMLDKLEESI